MIEFYESPLNPTQSDAMCPYAYISVYPCNHWSIPCASTPLFLCFASSVSNLSSTSSFCAARFRQASFSLVLFPSSLISSCFTSPSPASPAETADPYFACRNRRALLRPPKPPSPTLPAETAGRRVLALNCQGHEPHPLPSSSLIKYKFP